MFVDAQPDKDLGNVFHLRLLCMTRNTQKFGKNDNIVYT